MAETNLNYEDLIEIQRKEKKDLMAKIQKMKHSVPKGDKKKKKEMTAEITQMIADFDLKHEEQLKNFKTSSSENGILASEDVSTSESSFHTTETEEECTSQRISKAQKRRNKKVQQQKEREKAIAEQEIDNLTGLRHLELMKIKKKLSERGLTIHEIPSDGNCLYKAIEHQLSLLNIQRESSLRGETSNYLLQHKEEYLPFLTNPETGDILSDEEFVKYCEDISNTSAWGGQVEINVISTLCNKPVEVIQADSSNIVIGEEYPDPKLIISYHRYAYGLGEHYNSVVKKEISVEEDI